MSFIMTKGGKRLKNFEIYINLHRTLLGRKELLTSKNRNVNKIAKIALF